MAVVLGPLVEWLADLTREIVREEVAALRPAEREWLTVTDAAVALGVTPAVRMRIRRGRLEGRTDGRHVYVAAECPPRGGRVLKAKIIGPARQTPPEARTPGGHPMTKQVCGARSRRPVHSGTHRIRGLWERERADGSTVFEFAGRLGGSFHRHTLQASTKTDAIRELEALRVDYQRGEQHRSPAAGLPLRDVAADWLQHVQARIGHRDPRRRYSVRTFDLYQQRARDYIVPALGHLPIADVTVADVRRLLNTLGSPTRKPRPLAPATVTGVRTALSALCRYAIRNGLADRNPVRDLDRDDAPGTARQTEPRYLTLAEIDALLAELSDTFRPVAAACAYAAMRISEALGLTWENINFSGGTITITGQLGTGGDRVATKTEASAATVPLLPALARELRAHRSRQASRDLRLVHADALVFVTARGKPQSRRNALRAVYTAGDAVGLNGDDREPVGLHDLRHSFVALAFDAGVTFAEAARSPATPARE